MPERSGDWLRQAIRDLESAKAQLRDGYYEWSCFIARQAAEKALKAVFQKLGAEAWGHSLMDLLKALREKIELQAGLEDDARHLDRYYIPARYPNSWVSGAPSDYLVEKDAEDAVRRSEKILQFCHGFLAG